MIHSRNCNLDSLINKTAVYYLFDEYKNIIYIGASERLGNRLKAHKRGKNKPYKPFRYFAYTEVSFLELFKIEAFEINYHNPKYNISIPNIERFL